jgi:GNAT superfamily N-acetyltransferase
MAAKIVAAQIGDVPEIFKFISELAAFEKLEHEMVATEDALRESLFGPKRFAEVLFLEEDNGWRAGFALFFHNYSTFLAKPGIYLEDLFIRPAARGRGYGKALLVHLAQLAVARGCGRLEWWVLDWNQNALEFYKSVGAQSMSEWTVQRLTGEALTALAAGKK